VSLELFYISFWFNAFVSNNASIRWHFVQLLLIFFVSMFLDSSYEGIHKYLWIWRYCPVIFFKLVFCKESSLIRSGLWHEYFLDKNEDNYLKLLLNWCTGQDIRVGCCWNPGIQSEVQSDSMPTNDLRKNRCFPREILFFRSGKNLDKSIY